jgi:uncharacterized protein (DUF1810 family)
VAAAANAFDPVSMHDSPHNLERFVRAQQRTYQQALTELRAGAKESHWMWFVFPQLRELGQSPISREFGISGRDEAAAYAEHPVLGPRLVECVNTVLRHAGRSAAEILGEIDALKFRSCLTLFMQVSDKEPCFRRALVVFYGGEPDRLTLDILRK